MRTSYGRELHAGFASVPRVLVAAIAFLIVGGQAPPAAAISSGESGVSQLQLELGFRRDFGLNRDVFFVAGLMADPANYDNTYDVALTLAERAEMQRRLTMESEMRALEVRAEQDPAFAGHWIDQPAGGVINLAFAGDADSRRADLESLVPSGSTAKFINVKYRWTDLIVVRDRIDGDRQSLARQGIVITSVGIDPRSNQVEVTASNVALASEALGSSYGDAVAIESSVPVIPSGCTDRLHCPGPPLRAGIGAPTNVAIPCSIAFLVRKGTAVNWLTAGHCAKSVGVQWIHDGILIGTIRATCWPGCQFSDAARAGEINATYSSYHVWRSAAPTAMNHVISSQALNADDIGDQTCLNARRSTGWRCGYIDEIRTVTYPGGVYFDEQRYASFDGFDGDSGGAVHSPIVQGTTGVVAYGVQSGCEDKDGDGVCTTADASLGGRSIYSHIARVSSELGVSVCRSSAPCP